MSFKNNLRGKIRSVRDLSIAYGTALATGSKEQEDLALKQLNRAEYILAEFCLRYAERLQETNRIYDNRD